MHIVCFVCCFFYYFNCISFAIRLSGRKVAIKLTDWLIDLIGRPINRVTWKIVLPTLDKVEEDVCDARRVHDDVKCDGEDGYEVQIRRHSTAECSADILALLSDGWQLCVYNSVGPWLPGLTPGDVRWAGTTAADTFPSISIVSNLAVDFRSDSGTLHWSRYLAFVGDRQYTQDQRSWFWAAQMLT